MTNFATHIRDQASLIKFCWSSQTAWLRTWGSPRPCADAVVHRETRRSNRPKRGNFGVRGYRIGNLSLMPINLVTIRKKDVKIPIKNWKLTLHKSIAVETSVPSHRWFIGFKAHVNLNRIKVSIQVVRENIAAEKIPRAFAGNIKGNPIPADFWCRKIGRFGKTIICPCYHFICLVKMIGL